MLNNIVKTTVKIPPIKIQGIKTKVYPFISKLNQIDTTTYVLELFHGPTCAFKDFGARFMARVMSYS